MHVHTSMTSFAVWQLEQYTWLKEANFSCQASQWNVKDAVRILSKLPLNSTHSIAKHLLAVLVSSNLGSHIHWQLWHCRLFLTLAVTCGNYDVTLLRVLAGVPNVCGCHQSCRKTCFDWHKIDFYWDPVLRCFIKTVVIQPAGPLLPHYVDSM